MVLSLIISISIVALVFAGYLAWNIKKQDPGDKKTQELMHIIHEGAMKFLHKEYRILIIFVIIVALILVFVINQSSLQSLVIMM